jgi:multidrug efflux pump subunit AcrB
MKTLFTFFITNKKIAHIFTFAFIFFGINSVIDIKKDALPKVEFNTISIETIYPSASPEDVEKLLTTKLEDRITNITGIKTYNSISSEGFSDITIELENSIKDKTKIMQKIRDAVSRVELPREAKIPRVIEYDTSNAIPILSIGLFLSNKTSYTKLRKIVEDLTEEISQQEGVANIKKSGYLKREVKIFLDQKKLLKYNLTIDEVINRIKERNTRSTAGKFIHSGKEENIIILAEFKNPQEVGDVILSKIFDGPILRLKDIATLEDGYEKSTSITHINGHRAFYLSINKNKYSDIIQTNLRIKQVVEKFKTKHSDITINFYNDAAESVDKRLSVTLGNGLSGLILVFLVLALFLDKKIAFWVGIGVPVTLLGTVFYLNMINETLNLVSMIGLILVIGLVVDDAIVVSENIEKHWHLNKSKLQATIDGLSEVFPPILASILTTIAAFSPLLLMENNMGKFIFLIPLTVIIALIISLLEVVIALPAHLENLEQIKRKTWFDPIEQKFEKIVFKLFKKRYLIIVGFFILLIGSFVLWQTKLPFMLNGNNTTTSFTVEIKMPQHYDFDKRIKIISDVETIFIKTLDKKVYKSIISDINHIGSSIINVDLVHADERKETVQEIITQLKTKTKNIKQATFYYSNSSSLGVGKDIEFNLISKNDEEREQAVKKTISLLKSYSSVSDIKNGQNLGKAQQQVIIDYKQAAKLNISITSVMRYVRIALDGEYITQIRYQGETVAFRVLFKDTVKNYQTLKQLKIANRDGRLIPVVSFTDLQPTTSASDIEHYKGRRVTKITASVDKKLASPLKISQKIIDELSKEFSSLSIELGGEVKESKESSGALLKSFLIAIITIYIILFLLLNSFVQPMLVMLAIPFAFIGVIWAFYLHNEVLSFFALVGSIGLIGVVVNDSLLLMNHFNTNITNTINLVEQVAKKTSERLRAIVLTTVTTFMGVLPMVYNLFGSESTLRPMAMAMAYGLLFATILILILLPCFYLVYKDITQLKIKRFF